MLWYKSWLETRWRFVIGLIVLMMSVTGTVLAYPQLAQFVTQMPDLNLQGEIGRRVAEVVALSAQYRGYVWSQWFVQNMPQMWSVFAAVLGTGGLLSQVSGGGALFTLSLPATRSRLLGIRAATGLAELLALAIVPSLMLPLLSPFIGESYSVTDALVHSLCVFVGGSVFFSLAFLLSTVFHDVWRPALIVLCAAFVLSLLHQFSDLSRYSLLRVMNAEVYFREGEMPWLGLLTSAVVSGALIYGATRNIARQDF
jgi:ABC-2 type transport system permease protein